uniref:deoxyhypusine synthase n=1 Tax=Aceria tosichella TaxID=561515 RepID=A0A6G1SKR6_9ACAR
MSDQKPTSADSVLKPSLRSYCDNLTPVRGYNFEDESGQPKLDLAELLASFGRTGFQATQLSRAIDIVNKMLRDRTAPFIPNTMIEDEFIRPKKALTIFLAYTSNMISSGIRENICFLVKHKMVDCIVTTAGGVEEDLIKCLKHDEQSARTYVGDFRLSGSRLRENGINRIGNLLVPNDNYCRFEEWVMPILDNVLKEQSEEIKWTPSKLIERLGHEINHPDSVCYWAAKNKIPIFCPALTDGSLGDMLDFHTFKSPGLILDIVADIKRINTLARNTANSKTGVIVLGGGVAKHHTMNANLMRGGADYTVYINTSSEFDGSDSGAEPDEAVSWGKVRPEAQSAKVTCDATIAFPLLVAQTFFNHLK